MFIAKVDDCDPKWRSVWGMVEIYTYNELPEEGKERVKNDLYKAYAESYKGSGDQLIVPSMTDSWVEGRLNGGNYPCSYDDFEIISIYNKLEGTEITYANVGIAFNGLSFLSLLDDEDFQYIDEKYNITGRNRKSSTKNVLIVDYAWGTDLVQYSCRILPEPMPNAEEFITEVIDILRSHRPKKLQELNKMMKNTIQGWVDDDFEDFELAMNTVPKCNFLEDFKKASDYTTPLYYTYDYFIKDGTCVARNDYNDNFHVIKVK